MVFKKSKVELNTPHLGRKSKEW